MTIANPPLHIICGACGCNKEFDYEYVKGKLGEPDEVYVSCGNCATVATLSDVIPARKTEAAVEEEEDTEVSPIPACSSCTVPNSGEYSECKHVGLAIRESEFDVSAGSRRCSNFRGPGQVKKEESVGPHESAGCGNCAIPPVDYTKCKHRNLAIRGSKLYVLPEYRRCRYHKEKP